MGVSVQTASAQAAAATSTSVDLTLHVVDPVVVAALLSRTDQSEQETYALEALRIGVLAITQASGQMDITAIEAAGKQLISDLQSTVTSRGQEITSSLGEIASRYFAPSQGLLHTTISGLIGKDGELERAIQRHISEPNSTLSIALAKQLGDENPLFRLMSTEHKGNILTQIEVRLKEIFDAQAQETAKNFSMDNEESYLSKIVSKLTQSNQEIRSELSLDDQNGALSKLTKSINDQLIVMQKEHYHYHTDITSQLAAITARREEAQHGTRKGIEFEESLFDVVEAEAQKLTDIAEAVGSKAGILEKNKKGDIIVTLNSDSSAPGAVIVWEAKDNQTLGIKQARQELEEAKKNRQAQVGIFVYSSKAAPKGVAEFRRYGSDIMITWNQDDPNTDVFVRAAYSLARALCSQQTQADSDLSASAIELEKASHRLEKVVGYLTEIKTKSTTILGNAEKVLEAVKYVEPIVDDSIACLNTQVATLRRSE